MASIPLQCAWCRCLYDDGGTIGDPLPTMLPETSGGVCHVCVDRIFQQETERATTGGNRALAVHLERERVRLGRDLARERRAARTRLGREPVPEPIGVRPVDVDQSASAV